MKLIEKTLFLFAGVVLMQQFALAQAPGMLWQNCMGGTGYDQVTAIQQADDGGYACAIGSFDFKVVKLTPGGSIDWQKTYGGSDADVAYSIKTIPDHGYIVTGYTKSVNVDVTGNHGGADMWVLRIDILGNILWEKCYGGSGDEQGRSVAVDPTGGFIIAGLTTSYDGDVKGRVVKTTAPDCDLWVVKIDDTGRIVWQRSYGGSMSDAANCIRCTNDKGYIVIGDTYSNDGDVKHFHRSADTTSDMWAIKLNAAGDTVWERAMGGTGNETGSAIQQTIDGGYIAGGITGSVNGDVSGNHGDDDGWIVKLLPNGIIDWQKCIGGNNGDGIYDIDVTPDGWYVAAGVESSTNVTGNHGGYDFWITKLAYKGTIVWQKCLGGSNHDYGSCMAQSRDKGFVMGGWTMSNDGDVSGNHGGHYDTWVVKMDPDTMKVPPLNINNPYQATTVSLSPNPSTGVFKLQTPFNSGHITIYDLTGISIYESNITDQNSVIDIRNFAAGVYMLRINNNTTSDNYKLVKY